MDGGVTEDAILDASDETGSCSRNRLLSRLRRGGALTEDVSSDGGGSSEGSMPASS